MILTPGMEKYIKFNKDMQKLKCRPGHLMVSKDATKFGDLYMIELFQLQIIAAKGCGYLSLDEAKMLYYFSTCLENRIVLMPWQNAKSYIRSEKMDYVETAEKKWVLEMKQFSNYLNEPGKFDGFIKGSIMRLLKENPSFRKPVGFTLGVFNICGSLYTAAYTDMICDLETYLGLPEIFRGATHSDDAEDVTNVECPTKENFHVDNFEVSDLVEFLLLNNKKIYAMDGTFSYVGSSWSEVHQIDEKVIGKLHLILTLFTPRFFGQRPSLLKWGFGYANEVLQVVQFSQQVFVPLIRYSAAIGKELPGKSPASDTYMMTGRIYDILVNGGSHELVSNTIYALNWLISDMYDLHNYNRKINFPPENWGLWWAIPGRIYEQGFNSNEVRLQGYTTLETRNILRYMVNVPTLWEKEKKDNFLKDLFITESIGLDELDNGEGVARIDGGIEYRKDFQTRINRKIKVSLGMGKILDMYRKEIKSAYKDLKAKTKLYAETADAELKEMLKLLKDRWIIEINSGSKSLIQNVINIAGKYTQSNIQANYVRVSPDVKLISKMGYRNRHFTNPFTEEYRMRLNDLIGLNMDVCTVEEIQKALAFLANQEWKIPDVNEKGVQLIRKILGNFIGDEASTIIDKNPLEEVSNIDSLVVQYVKIQDRRELFGVGRYAVKAMAAVFEMGSSKDKLILNDTFVVKSDSKLENNKDFAEQVQLVKAFLSGNGFSIRDIFDHFRLLSRLLSEKMFNGIAKLPDEHFRFELSTGYFWRHNIRRIYNRSYNPQQIINLTDESNNNNNKVDIVDKLPFSSVRFDRIISSIYWGNVMFPDTIPLTGKIIMNGAEFRIPKPHILLEQLSDNNFSYFKANQLLSSLMWYHRTEHYIFQIGRNKVGKDYFLSLQIGAIPLVYFHGYEFNNEWKWEIFATSFKVGRNIGSFLFVLLRLTTFWLVAKTKRCTDIKQIISPKKSLFALFGSEISYEDNGADSWTYLSIYLKRPNILDKITILEGDVKNYGVEFVYSTINKARGSNIYLLTPWNLGVLGSGLLYVVNNTVMIKDTKDYLPCRSHDWYLTFRVDGSNEQVISEKYSKLNLKLCIYVCNLILSIVEWEEKKVNLNVGNFADVVSKIRELELYLGIPLSMLIKVTSKKYNSMYDKNIPIEDEIRKMLYLYAVDISTNIVSRIDKIRLIGYFVCIDDVDLYKYDYIQFSFLKTMKKELVLKWDKNDEAIETENFQVDLDRRWERSSNLPISVFSIFLSSIPQLNKIASFYNVSNGVLFNDLATDEIYLMNAIECSSSPEILKIIRYLGIV